jgi:hypothetical protein
MKKTNIKSSMSLNRIYIYIYIYIYVCVCVCVCVCFLMFSLSIQILMNVKRRKPVSALSVAARIPGGATNALAVEIFCISGTMIPALVSPATHPL